VRKYGVLRQSRDIVRPSRRSVEKADTLQCVT
jgi:hypothetical protein